jgi:hypothetical protein
MTSSNTLLLFPLKCLWLLNKHILDESPVAPTLSDSAITLLTPSTDSGECLCLFLEEIVFEGCRGITDNAVCLFPKARTTYSHMGVVRLVQATFNFYHVSESCWHHAPTYPAHCRWIASSTWLHSETDWATWTLAFCVTLILMMYISACHYQ